MGETREETTTLTADGLGLATDLRVALQVIGDHSQHLRRRANRARRRGQSVAAAVYVEHAEQITRAANAIIDVCQRYPWSAAQCGLLSSTPTSPSADREEKRDHD